MSSWYNHITIGSVDKPLIPNGELKRICEELDKGNMEVLKELSQWTLLDNTQKYLIADKIEKHGTIQKDV